MIQNQSMLVVDKGDIGKFFHVEFRERKGNWSQSFAAMVGGLPLCTGR